MNEKEFKVLFEKILDIIENNKGEKKRIQIRDLWNSLKFDDCNNFAKYLKNILTVCCDCCNGKQLVVLTVLFCTGIN